MQESMSPEDEHHKVAFVIHTISSDTEGTQKQLLSTILKLKETSFRPLLVVLRSSPWLDRNDIGCPVVDLKFDGFIGPSIFSTIQRLTTVWRENGVDIVHAYFAESIILCFLSSFLENKPRLFSARRDIGLGKKNAPWYHTLYDLVMPVVNTRYVAVIANSESVKSHTIAKERLNKKKCHVIPNGVSLPQQETSYTNPTISKELLQGNDSTVNFCIVASLTPVKRHDLLISAFAAANNSGMGKDIKLWILGDGPLRSEMEERARGLGLRETVSFVGAVTNVVDWLRTMHVGILCSDREGLSNAIMEYMSAGLPTIATNVGGNPELLSDGRGVLIPAGDESALEKAIVALSSDPDLRQSIGTNSKQFVEKNFSWESNIESLTHLYRSAIQGQI